MPRQVTIPPVVLEELSGVKTGVSTIYQNEAWGLDNEATNVKSGCTSHKKVVPDQISFETFLFRANKFLQQDYGWGETWKQFKGRRDSSIDMLPTSNPCITGKQ